MRKININDLFGFYYERSSEFKGDYPDTKQEFIERCLVDFNFYVYWVDKYLKANHIKV